MKDGKKSKKSKEQCTEEVGFGLNRTGKLLSSLKADGSCLRR